MNMLLLRNQHITSGGLFNQENTHILIYYKMYAFNGSTTVLTHHNKLSWGTSYIFRLSKSGWITTGISDFDHSLQIPVIIHPDKYLRVNYWKHI